MVGNIFVLFYTVQSVEGKLLNDIKEQVEIPNKKSIMEYILSSLKQNCHLQPNDAVVSLVLFFYCL